MLTETLSQRRKFDAAQRAGWFFIAFDGQSIAAEIEEGTANCPFLGQKRTDSFTACGPASFAISPRRAQAMSGTSERTVGDKSYDGHVVERKP